MRRKDREVTDSFKIDEIIRSCDCCRLGFTDGEEAYIVPMNFAFVHEGTTRTFFFHSAKQGRKIELIQKNGRAGFELDTNHLLTPSELACSYAFRYQSVIGNGVISTVEDREKKVHVLRLMMEQYSGCSEWTFEEKMVDAVIILQLTVTDLSCKEHP